jgi:hypothetical protein
MKRERPSRAARNAQYIVPPSSPNVTPTTNHLPHERAASAALGGTRPRRYFIGE